MFVATLLTVFTLLILWTNPTLLPFAKEKYRKDEFDLIYGSWGVVCGASEGIGLEWAFALAERGLNVVLIGRNGTGLNAATDALSHAIPHLKYIAIELDLADIDKWRTTATKLAKDLDVGFVVYNAAYSPVGPFDIFGMEMHEHVVKVNVHAPTIAVAAFVPRMIQKGKGGIVLMSSVDGEGCSPDVTNYSGTKAWTTRMAEGLWYELGAHGIDVLGVIAGLTTTTSVSRVLDKEKRQQYLWAMESSPRDVVMESLKALGKGQPTVITGTGSRLVTWMRWVLPRSIGCGAMSGMKVVLKSEEERKNAAQSMMGGKRPEL